MFRELAFTIVVAFTSAIIAISVFYFGFMHKPKLETSTVFSTIYERCRDYVENAESFDTTKLLQGGLHSSTTNAIGNLKGQNLWHHPQELIVVRTIERSIQNTNRRQCRISLSKYGKRPPTSTIGLVMMEFFSIKSRLLADGNHLEYAYKYPVPETFSFRSKSIDELGCAVIHSFSLDTIGENFQVHIFQEGIACQL